MEILNQPHAAKIGNMLNSILSGNQLHRFDTFSFLVAYVKTSGVDRLAASIQQFKQTNGRVRGVVGVSRYQKNTSVQGLQHLLPLCDEIWVYNNESPTSTFHPKVYIFEKADEKATVFVGSSNLTAGGLYTNYEVNSCSNYDLTKPTEVAAFLTVKQMLATYSNPSQFCKALTPEYLQELYTDGYLSNEQTEPYELSEDKAEKDRKERKFGSERINPPSAAKPQTEIPLPAIDFGPTQDQWATKGKLVWRKQLVKRDLQIVRRGTAPTGSMGLTQADFRVNGKHIHHTTYFKRKVFANFNWQRNRAKSKAATTKVLFNVKIMGKDLGQHQLTLRFKPRWEAKQGNFTTSISWGDLTKSIKNPALLDKQIALYAPAKGKKQPFYIEIS